MSVKCADEQRMAKGYAEQMRRALLRRKSLKEQGNEASGPKDD